MDTKKINKKLASLGHHLDGRPLYRLVWSNDQIELRHGMYQNVVEFVDNEGRKKDLYLGEQEQTKRTLKYPNNPDRWVLEKLYHFPPNPELPESGQGDYEPLWVFQDKEGNYLSPEWFAIDYIIASDARGPQSNKSYFDNMEEFEKKRRKEAIAKALGVDLNPSRVESSFAFKEAVALPGKTWQ